MFIVQITINELANTSNPHRYVTDQSSDGSVLTLRKGYAKTWKTRQGAQRWIDSRDYNNNNGFAIAEVVEA